MHDVGATGWGLLYVHRARRSPFLFRGGVNLPPPCPIGRVYIVIQNPQYCAVKLAREHLGEDNHNTISIANNAAHLYRDMGRTDTAEEMSYLSFHGAQRLMGIDHPDTLSAMFLHSKIQFQQDQHRAAMEGMRLCILGSKRKHGEHHFLTLYREKELAAVEKIYEDCRLLTPLDNAPANSR